MIYGRNLDRGLLWVAHVPQLLTLRNPFQNSSCVWRQGAGHPLRCPRVRDFACLVVVAHQGSAAILGAQEPIDEHGPPKRKMELNVLLKVSTQLVTVQVVAKGEALPRDQHVHLTPHRRRKEGFQAVCQEEK